MKKVLCLVITICMCFMLFGCTDKDTNNNIISQVDTVEGYKEIKLTSEELASLSKGTIEKVFFNDGKYVVLAMGNDGYKGDVEVVVLIDNDTISKIKGYNIKETDTVGSRAFEDAFLLQFIGKNITEMERFRGDSKPSNNVDILYVTGATYSSKAVINAMNVVIEWYKIKTS